MQILCLFRIYEYFPELLLNILPRVLSFQLKEEKDLELSIRFARSPKLVRTENREDILKSETCIEFLQQIEFLQHILQQIEPFH